MKDRIYLAVGTCFGLGLAPIAPGSFGALVGVAIFIAIVLAAPVALHGWLIAAALILYCVLTIVMSPWAERHFKVKDSGNYVLDEVAGYLTTVLLFRPLDNLVLTLIWTYLLTRIIDIIKPWPCRRLEYLPGGWGVLADDLWASVYTAGLLHLIYHFAPALFGAAA